MKKIILFILISFMFVACNKKPILIYENDELKISYEYDDRYKVDVNNLKNSFTFLSDDEIELYMNNRSGKMLKQLEKENLIRSAINNLKNVNLISLSEYEVLEDRIKNLNYNETDLKLEKLNQFLKEVKLQNETLNKLFIEFYHQNLSDDEIIKKLYQSKKISLFLISPENITKEKYQHFVERQKVFDKIEPYIKEANKDLILPEKFYYYLLEKKYISSEEINVFLNNETAKVELTNLYIKKTGTYIDTIKEYNSNKEEEEEMKRNKNSSMVTGATAGIATAIILNKLVK